MTRRLLPLLALVLAATACSPPSTPPAAAPKARASAAARPLDVAHPVAVAGSGTLVPVPVPTTLPAASATPGPAPSGAKPLPTAAPTAAPAPLITLGGTVLAPAGVLSNNGGGIVANHGSGVVANNGAAILANNAAGIVPPGEAAPAGSVHGAYRMLAVAQAPLAGARVYVLDAQGRVIQGKDGQALYATTDAQGRYGFTGGLPSHNFLLAVELADGKGLWQAILPKDAAEPRQVDLDLISTLTTGYILGQYVASQADQQATLDKLPAAAEAETRGKAGAAFDKAGAKVPDRFDRDVTVPVVDGLRQQDPSFNDQMEVVKRLLIAAGQSDFGNGQTATKTRFGRLQTVLPLADGSFWLCSQDDGRIWRVDPAGTLHALAGTGVKGAAPTAGQLATAAALAGPSGLTRDDQGRLVFLDGERLLRVEADGKLAVACAKVSRGEYVFAAGADAYAVADFDGHVIAVAGGQAGAAMAPDYAASLPAGTSAGRLQSAGRRPDGKVAVVTGASDPADFMAAVGVGCVLDGAGHASAPPALPGRLMGVAQDGTWVSLDLDGALVFTPPSGAALRCPPSQVAKLPDFGPFSQLKANRVDANGFWNVRFAFGNGKGYVFSMYEAHELAADGSVRHVAGLDPARVADGDASAVALDTPTGVAVAPDGTLYLTDNALKQVLKRDPAGAITRLSGVGGWEIASLSRPGAGKATLRYGSHPAIEFGATYQAPAAEARYSFPSLIRLDAQGHVLVLDMSMFLRRLELNGDLRSLYDAGVTGGNLADYLPQADGSILLAQAEASGARIARLAPGGQVTTVVDVPGVRADYMGEPLAIATGPDGTLYVLANDGLFKVDGGSLVPLVTDARLAAVPDNAMGTVARLAVDAGKRVYVTSGDNVLRWSPGASQLETLAGPGGKLLTGSTADDSLQAPMSPAFGPTGDLYVVDSGNKQVKRLAAGQL